MKTQNSYNINQNTYNEDILFNNFSSNSIIFHRLKSKTNDFCLRKNRIMGQEIASLQKIRQNFCPGFRSYIKFHISSVTLCDLSLFNILIPTYWHQEEPSRPSEFGQSNYVFKRYVYIVAYLGIMLQASWHIPEGN